MTEERHRPDADSADPSDDDANAYPWAVTFTLRDADNEAALDAWLQSEIGDHRCWEEAGGSTHTLEVACKADAIGFMRVWGGDLQERPLPPRYTHAVKFELSDKDVMLDEVETAVRSMIDDFAIRDYGGNCYALFATSYPDALKVANAWGGDIQRLPQAPEHQDC